MSQLADTSIFIAHEAGRVLGEGLEPVDLAVSVVTAAELQAGVLVAAGVRERTRRLESLTWALELTPIPIDEPVALVWAELRVALAAGRRRLAVNDSWIAATAIAHGLQLVTRDRDFVGIPELDVLLL